MKLLLLSIILGIVGCHMLHVEKDKYYEQVRILDERMLKGDLSFFLELDVWGRKWELIERSIEDADEYVPMSYKFKSRGATVGDESDDFVVKLLLHRSGTVILNSAVANFSIAG
jgi:hypothetical protein